MSNLRDCFTDEVISKMNNTPIQSILHRPANAILFSYNSAIEMALREICKKRPELLKNRDDVMHYVQQKKGPTGVLEAENHLISYKGNPVAAFTTSVDYLFGVVGHSDITYFD